MSNLLKSIADIWEGSETLCALIPFDRVFTGRVPQTQQYPLPYVSILSTPGRSSYRSDKTDGSHSPLSFHIWVDDADLATGLEVAEAIYNTYANRCWSISETFKVLDVLDEGEPCFHQTNMATVKAWEVVKLFTVCLERTRATHTDDCCGTGSEGSNSQSQ